VTRLARRDLAWRDNEVVWGAHVPQSPDREAMVTALRTLFAADPLGHFARHLDAEAGTWHRPGADELHELAGRLVSAHETPYAVESFRQRMCETQGEPLAGSPFHLAVGPDWSTLHFNHALGDARTMWPLFIGLMAPDRLAEFVPANGGPRHPLLTALWASFGRHPGRLARLARVPRPPFALNAEGTVPFRSGATQMVSMRSGAGFRGELLAYRKATAPDASAVGVLVARAMSAIRDRGLTPYDGVSVVADVRRHLPGRRFDAGNFTAGAYLALPDPYDALTATRAIDEFVNSARPLLTLSLMTARAKRGPRTEPVWKESEDRPRTLVSFSHVGRLYWPGEPPISGYVLGKPVGRYGLAIVTYEIGKYMYASVSYDGRSVPRETAETVAAALTSIR